MIEGYVEWEFGFIKITGDENKIINITITKQKEVDNAIGEVANAKKQLIEYLNHERKEFDLNLELNGTDFQIKAWKALQQIPYGKTITYKKQAEDCGVNKGYQAIGNANGKNKIAIVIPCHRVIGSNDQLTGYAYGIEIKKWLLDHEIKGVQKRTI